MKTWAESEITNSGGTNFILPLEEAFSMIEAYSSTSCTNAILFLTDGVADFTDANYVTVQDRAALNDVVMFTYAFGSGRFSCIEQQ
jgi:hypothetical protein